MKRAALIAMFVLSLAACGAANEPASTQTAPDGGAVEPAAAQAPGDASAAAPAAPGAQAAGQACGREERSGHTSPVAVSSIVSANNVSIMADPSAISCMGEGVGGHVCELVGPTRAYHTQQSDLWYVVPAGRTATLRLDGGGYVTCTLNAER